MKENKYMKRNYYSDKEYSNIKYRDIKYRIDKNQKCPKCNHSLNIGSTIKSDGIEYDIKEICSFLECDYIHTY